RRAVRVVEPGAGQLALPDARLRPVAHALGEDLGQPGRLLLRERHAVAVGVGLDQLALADQRADGLPRRGAGVARQRVGLGAGVARLVELVAALVPLAVGGDADADGRRRAGRLQV